MQPTAVDEHIGQQIQERLLCRNKSPFAIRDFFYADLQFFSQLVQFFLFFRQKGLCGGGSLTLVQPQNLLHLNIVFSEQLLFYCRIEFQVWMLNIVLNIFQGCLFKFSGGFIYLHI